MKRVLILIGVVSVLLLTIGCAKLVSEETEVVEVTIVDAYHRGSWLQPVRAGNVTTFITHPAVYRITVVYDGVQFDISGRDTYMKYKDCIGQITTATLIRKTYDNGKVYRSIESLH